MGTLRAGLLRRFFRHMGLASAWRWQQAKDVGHTRRKDLLHRLAVMGRIGVSILGSPFPAWAGGGSVRRQRQKYLYAALRVTRLDYLEPRLLLTTLYWDPNGATGVGGNGTWDLTSTNWNTDLSGNGTPQAWVQGADAVFQGSSGTVSLASGISTGALTFSTSGYTVSGSNILTVAGSPITIDSGVTAILDVPVTGVAGLDKEGAGTLVLTGTNTYSGGTTVGAGTLQVGNSSASGTLGAGPIADNGALRFADTGTTTIGDAITGSGTVETVAGTVILTAANTYTGATTIDAGSTLQVGSGSNSTAQLGSATNSLLAGTVTINGTLAFELSGSPGGPWYNSMSGGGNIALLTNGSAHYSIKLDGTNTGFVGHATVASRNRLQLDNTPLGSASSVSVQSGGALFLNFGAVTTYSGNIAIAGLGYSGDNGNFGALRVGGSTTTITGPITLIDSAMLYDSARATVSGMISDGGGGYSLEKSGGSTLTLSGSNSYSGGTVIDSGILKISSDTNLGAATGLVTFAGNSTLQTGSNTTLPATRSIVINSGVLATLDTTTKNVEIDGVVSGGGGLTKIGTGPLTLAGANTYSGITTIAAGMLIAINDTALGTTAGGTIVNTGASLGLSGDINIGAEALQLSGTGANGVGALVNESGRNTFAGAMTLSSAATLASNLDKLTLAGSSIAGNFSLTIQGAGDVVIADAINTGTAGVTMSGTGVLFLENSSNTYSGPTTLNAGIMQLDGNIPNSDVTVNTGAQLTGNGQAKSVTLNGGVQTGIPFYTVSLGNLTLGETIATITGSLSLKDSGIVTQTSSWQEAVWEAVTGSLRHSGKSLSFDANTGIDNNGQPYRPFDVGTVQELATKYGADFSLNQSPFSFSPNTKLIVVEDGGGIDYDDYYIPVQVTQGSVSISGNNAISEGSSYTLNLSSSGIDPATMIWNIHWGDGTTQSVPGNPSSVSHVFSEGGNRTISATVADGAANYTANHLAVTVGYVAPTLQTGANLAVQSGATFRIPLATFTSPGFGAGETFTATVDWGDGSAVEGAYVSITPGSAGQPAQGSVIGQHNYGTPGTYPVNVILQPANGDPISLDESLTVESPSQPFLIPGPIGSMTTVSFTITNNPFSAFYRNEAGLYFVDDAQGDIGSLQPSDPGYIAAALGAPTSQVVFARNAAVGQVFSFLLPAGKYVDFYMVQDATTANYLNQTFPAEFVSNDALIPHYLNDPTRPNVFFVNSAANFDDFMHVRFTQTDDGIQYGFEDLTDGGDQDFDDLVFTVSATPAPTLTATANDASNEIDLSWNDVADEHGFQIYRGTTQNNLQPYDTVSGGQTTFADADVTAGVTYYYDVAPLSADNQPGGTSNIAHAALTSSTNQAPVFDSSPDTSFDILTAVGPSVTNYQQPSADPLLGSIAGQAFYDANSNSARDHLTTNSTNIQLVAHGNTPILAESDDDSSELLPLGFTLNFFGQNYDHFYINKNGNVSFAGPVGTWTAYGFPTNSGKPMIAPFWADADNTTGAGEVYFTSGINDQGRHFVQIDWVNVGYYSSHDDKRNNFSLYIQDNPDGADVAFFYRNMQWTTGDASSGVDGFGGSPAEIGFDASDGVHYVTDGQLNTPAAVSAISNTVLAYKLTQDGYPVQYTETGTDGLTIQLLDGSGTIVASQPAHSADIDGNGIIDPITEQGLFRFDNLQAGTYTIREVPTGVWNQTFPASASYSISVATGEHVNSVLFGDDRKFSYTAHAIDSEGDPLSYTLIAAPQGAQWNASTNTVSWLPTAPGSYHFEIDVSDGHGNTVSQPFDLQVDNIDPEVNPSIASTPPEHVVEGKPYAYYIAAVDPNPSDPLTYTLLDHPTGMTLDPTSHTLQWTPTTQDPETVKVQVTDGRGGVATQQFTITVDAAPTYLPPAIAPIGSLQAVIGQEFQYPISATDPQDGTDGLSYDLIGSVPDGMHMQQVTGTIFGWTPTAAQEGITYTLNVRVRDQEGMSSIISFPVTVVAPTPVNLPAAPTNLFAVSGPVPSAFLSWDASQDPSVLGYNIYRGSSLNGPFDLIDSVDSNSYYDSNVTLNQTYYYEITAVNDQGLESLASDTKSVTPIDDETAPGMPTDFVATGTNEGISLTWDTNAESDLAGYILYHSDSLNGIYNPFASFGPTQTSYVDTSVSPGQHEYYVLAAMDFAWNLSTPPAGANATRASGQPVVQSINASVDPQNTQNLILDASANDPAGGTLTYTWSFVDGPAGSAYPTFSANNAADANHTVVTFYKSGSYTVDVTVTNAAGQSADLQQVISVDPVETTLAITPNAVQVAENGSQVFVASVYDQFGDTIPDDPNAPRQIQWQILSGSPVGQIASDGTYTANTQAGTDTVGAQYTTSGGSVLYAQAFADVESSPYQLSGNSYIITLVQDQTWTQPVARFTNTEPGTSLSDYTASIDWGDGTSVDQSGPNSTVVLSQESDGTIVVSGAHSYSQVGDGPYSLEVTLTYTPTTTSLQVPGSVTVIPAQLSATAVNVSTTTSEPLNNAVVATFTGPVADTSASDYEAFVNWGDGTITQGVIQAASAGFEVLASHGYPAAGSIPFSVLIRDSEGGQALVNGTATITAVSVPVPTNFTAGAIASDRVYLSWDYSSDVLGYVIWRTNTATGQTVRIPAQTNQYAVGSRDGNRAYKIDLNLPASTTYSYQIQAVDANGNVSALVSAPDSATTDALPDAPMGLSATALSGTRIDLTWDNAPSGQNVYGWDVLRSTSPTGPYESILPSGQYVFLPDGQTTPAFTDTTCNPNTTYYYEIEAVRQELPLPGSTTYEAAKSQPSLAAFATTSSGVNTPSTPANLVAGYAGQGRVNLQWDYPAGADILGYDIYRSTDPHFVPSAATLIGSEASRHAYSDDNRNNGNKNVYYYRVVAVIDDGDGNELSSQPSNVAGVDTNQEPTSVPAGPSQLKAIEITGDHVTLTWQDNALIETQFNVYRQDMDNGGGWATVGNVTTDSTSFTDTSIIPNTHYQYFVAAVNEVVTSSVPDDGHSSDAISVTTPVVGNPPSAPANLHRMDDGQTTPNQIHLSWQAASDDPVTVASYFLYRSAAGANQFTRIAVLNANQTDYVDKTLPANTIYDYKVVAVSATNAQSAAAEGDDISTLVAPNVAPVIAITSPGAYTGFNVDWGNSGDSAQTDGRIQSITPVRITVDDPNQDLVSWSLTLQPINVASQNLPGEIPLIDSTQYGTLYVGSSLTGADQAICALDPSLYPSGEYNLVLTATDAINPPTVKKVEVSLASNTKLGNLALPVTDLQFNVPGGQPITVTRVYDSQNANNLEEFGYGWKLQISDSSVSTTTTQGSGTYGVGNALRPGDLVYIKVPSGQQYTFQFWPVPDSYTPDSGTGVGVNPYDPSYASSTYAAQFVAVDGSGATLAVPGDINQFLNDRTNLYYDTSTRELYTQDENGQRLYNISNPAFGSDYTLKTADGTVYTINANSGQLSEITDSNGNATTYSGGTVTSGGYHLAIDTSGPGKTIKQVQLLDGQNHPVGEPITYSVYLNTSDLHDPLNYTLTSVTGTDGNTTSYGYAVVGDQPHLLSQVVDGRGIPVLNASYNNLGQVTSLTDAYGHPTTVGTGGFTGTNASQIATDAAGNTTEDIYDANGNVVREITIIKDGQGNPIAYSVKVTQYSYSSSDLSSQISNIFVQNGGGVATVPGATNANALMSVQEWQSFTVPIDDPQGQRYSQQPTVMLHEVDYSQGNNSIPTPTDPGLHQPSSETFYLGQDGTGRNIYRVVNYSNYVLGKPENISEVIEARDNQGQVLSSTPVSSASTNYDPATGNLNDATDALGNTTYYEYTTSANTAPDEPYAGLAVGLLLRTYSVRPGGDPDVTADQITTSVNAYYLPTDTAPGTSSGRLKYTIDAAEQESYYAYDAMGNTVLSYTRKTWTNADGSQTTGWVGTTTRYDSANRVTDTYQGVFQESALVPDTRDAAGNPLLNTKTSIVNGSPVVDVAETPFSGFNSGNGILLTSHTAYTPDGKVDWSQDQYGGVTRYSYDAKGELVRTLYPDGTEVRSAYDVLGRVIWQTDRYKTNTTYDAGTYSNDNTTTALATWTEYDSLGRVSITHRMNGVLISMDADTFTVNVPNQPPTVSIPTTDIPAGEAAGTEISHTQSYYDNAGRVAETVDSSGQRFGTIYYADGQVEFTGPLLTTLDAADPANGTSNDPASFWYNNLPATVDPAAYFDTYTSYLYNQLDASNQLYDRVIDQNGHHTDTYKDALGRVVKTIYNDGSFTETLYGTGGQAISRADLDATAPTTAEGWNGIPAGGSEQIQIAHRQASDTPVATYYVYDAAGRLTDVWLPAVADAQNSGAMTRPHWHYAYDVAGNQTSQTDPLGHITTFGYDQNGNQVRKTLPDGELQTWTYDDFGNAVLHKVYGAPSSTGVYGAAVQTTWDVYDVSAAHGQRLQAEYRYAEDFTPTAGQDPDSTSYNEKTRYVYDDIDVNSPLPVAEQLGMGRVAEVDQYALQGGALVQSGSTHTTYDPVTGQPASIATVAGTVNYAYDPATGRHMRTWTTRTVDGTTVIDDDTAYSYDSQGRLANVYTLVLDDTVYGAYTGVDSVTHNPTVTGSPLTVSYTYDDAGNLKTDSQPNGVTTTYTYDDLNRLTDVSVTQGEGDTPVFTQHYTLLANGLRQSVVETRYNADGTLASQTQTNWTYDDDGRLIREALSLLQGTSAVAAYADSFKFDLESNRVEEDIDAGNDGTTDDTITYTYNHDDQMLTETEKDSVSATVYTITYGHTANGVFVQGYDATGNMTEKHRTGTELEDDTYTWNLAGQMTSATVNGVTTTYTYDANGVRISETTGNTTTFYLNDPENPTGYSKAIEEKTVTAGTSSAVSTAPSRSYIFGLKVEGQSDATNGTVFLVTDGHGSTRVVISLGGVNQASYDYDAFGTALGFSAATAITPWLFAGDGAYDPATGFTYQLARWRDGFRFISGDSYSGDIQSPLSLHKYLYANGNLINMVDPSGYDAILEELATETIDASLDSIELPSLSVSGTAASSTVNFAALYGSTLSQIAGIAIGTGTLLTLAYYWEMDLAQIAQHQQAITQAYNQAIQTASTTTTYTKQQIKNMPVFFVYRTGPDATPQIWQNDVDALQGKRSGGWSAPAILNYLPGVNKINRPQAMAYAALTGVIAGPGQQIDEYPFASTAEGGATPYLHVAAVPAKENNIQGVDLSIFYGTFGYKPFTFLVLPVP